MDQNNTCVESPSYPHASAFEITKDGLVKGQILFKVIEFSSVPLTQFDLQPVYPSYGNKFKKVESNLLKMYSDKLWDDAGRPLADWGKSDKHESLTAPVIKATIEYAGVTDGGHIPGILYYLGRKNGTEGPFDYYNPIIYEHFKLSGTEVYTTNQYRKPLEEMFTAKRHFTKFDITPWQWKEAGFWIRADFLRCHIAPTAFLMLLDHNSEWYLKDLVVDLYIEASQDGNHWIKLSHLQLTEFDCGKTSAYASPGLKFEVPAELQGTFYQTFRIRITANTYNSKFTITAFDIFGTVAPVPVAEQQQVTPPPIFSFQPPNADGEHLDYPCIGPSSRDPWGESPKVKSYYLQRTEDRTAYNAFVKTLDSRSISLMQTPRQRYEGFRMCGIPLEEQVNEKDCCGGQVETIMDEYLAQYECPINACLKSEIIAAVSRECMRPGGMTEQEVRERLVLLVLENRAAF